MSEQSVNKVLDARGKPSPQPTLLAKESLMEMEHGQILEIRVTDPENRADLLAFTKRSGDKLAGEENNSEYISFFVRKRAWGPSPSRPPEEGSP
ncbi:MAG: sulfurtransferase TusA family protein [Desulfarculaceae bacterium]